MQACTNSPPFHGRRILHLPRRALVSSSTPFVSIRSIHSSAQFIRSFFRSFGRDLRQRLHPSYSSRLRFAQGNPIDDRRQRFRSSPESQSRGLLAALSQQLKPPLANDEMHQHVFCSVELWAARSCCWQAATGKNMPLFASHSVSQPRGEKYDRARRDDSSLPLPRG